MKISSLKPREAPDKYVKQNPTMHMAIMYNIHIIFKAIRLHAKFLWQQSIFDKTVMAKQPTEISGLASSIVI